MPPRDDDADSLFDTPEVEMLMHPLLVVVPTPLETPATDRTSTTALTSEKSIRMVSESPLLVPPATTKKNHGPWDPTSSPQSTNAHIASGATSSSSSSSSFSSTTAKTVEKTTTATQTHVPQQQRHLVLPTDTWAGLCLFYRVTSRALQKANPGCSGGRSLPVYQWLIIPTSMTTTATIPQRQQDTHTPAFRQALVKFHCPTLKMKDIQRYLVETNHDVEKAVQQAQADLLVQQQQEQAALDLQRRQRAEALAVQTIYRKLARQQQQQQEDDDSNNTGTIIAIELSDHTTPSKSSFCCPTSTAARQTQPATHFLCQNLGLQQLFHNFHSSHV